MASTTKKLIIAFATTALLLTTVVVTLWQTGVIFSPSPLTSGAHESSKNFSKDFPKGVAIAATTHVYTNVTTEITAHASTNVTTAATTHVSTYVTTDATNDAVQDASHELTIAANQVSTDRKIYFATMGSGIKALSTETSQVTLIADPSVESSVESFYAVAYDRNSYKLYWTTNYKMYRSEADGTNVETLLDTRQYGWFWGLACDWIAGRVYLVTENGFVIACDVSGSWQNKCATVLSGQGRVAGIALDPNMGTMYFTTSAGSIKKAHMDGSNFTTFASGLNSPAGVVIHHGSQRLYWTEWGGRKIQYAGLDGSHAGIKVVDSADGPWGIAFADRRLYWSIKDENPRIMSSTEIGLDITVVHVGSSHITHMAFQDSKLPGDRENHCTGKACNGGVCVLTPDSYKCLLKN